MFFFGQIELAVYMTALDTHANNNTGTHTHTHIGREFFTNSFHHKQCDLDNTGEHVMCAYMYVCRYTQTQTQRRILTGTCTHTHTHTHTYTHTYTQRLRDSQWHTSTHTLSLIRCATSICEANKKLMDTVVYLCVCVCVART